MKMKNLLIEKQEREAQASSLPKREDTAISSQNINKILETGNFLDIAMFYAQNNIKTFPVKKQGKSPLCPKGFKDATIDKVVLQEWNKKFPDCNIGIPTGQINNIFVVDVDGEQGIESLNHLELIYGKLDAPTVKTGKGKHLYFKMPENVELKCSTSKIADHIDIRANGGYVVAPPSIHENGHQYTWENFIPNQGFPEAPSWLISLITNTEKQPLPVSGVLEEISNAPQGQRNDTLYKRSISLIARAMRENLNIADIKENIINAAMQSGLSTEEALKTFDNALKFAETHCDNQEENEPDMDILKTKILLPAPKLNTKIFKGLENWVNQTAESTNAPVDYVAFSLLAGAAGVVGLSRCISPWAGWEESCCLWVGAIGEPSSGKTPATTPIRKILNEIEVSRKSNYSDKLAEWKRKREVAKKYKKEWEENVKENPASAPHFPNEAIIPAKPQTYRFVYGDTTQEALTSDMERNIKGAILFRDELSAWISGMNRYNSGSSERGFWLEAFNGNKFICNRVKFDDERLEIQNLLVSVFGTIQPQRLIDTVLSDRGDGFLARFLWVYPELKPAAIPQNIALPKNVLAAFDKLDSLLDPYADNAENQKKCLPLSIEAQQLFNTWYLAHLNKSQQEESILKYFLGKGQGYVLRLALLLELLWWADSEYPEPTEVSFEAIQAAIELYDTYLTPMCERVYNMYYSPSQNIEARALAKWIIENKPQSFILRDVYNNGNVANLRRKEQAEKAANKLIALGWLTCKSSREGNTKGRSRKTYCVISEVYELAENY